MALPSKSILPSPANAHNRAHTVAHGRACRNADACAHSNADGSADACAHANRRPHAKTDAKACGDYGSSC